MGIRNKISSGYVYYLTLTVEEWIDVFSRPAYKHIIIDSLNYCIINKGLEVYCWCLMSNHLHLIARAKEIHSVDFLDEKMNYIHNNPVRAELVANPEDYLYSSARDYAGEKGLIDIEFA